MNGGYDVIFAGGGLASGLAAYRLKLSRPELNVLVLEQGTRLGGEHTWSFHSTDLSASEHQWVRPLLSRSWAAHVVRFPAHQRTLFATYHSIKSQHFHAVIASRLGESLRLGTCVSKVEPNAITLEDGTVLTAACVIDARGFSKVIGQRVGYQKFIGWDVELELPHGLTGPILMDATCEQKEGFRFFYVLPWSDTSLLIEDTRYSDEGGIDPEAYRREIEVYAAKQGWRIKSWVREEQGSLPIPLANVFLEGKEKPWIKMREQGLPAIGVRAGVFHPTTGYSFPDAVRLADALASLPDLTSAAVALWISNYVERENSRRWFFRFLNRMLFQGAKPELRYRVLERFYRLPETLIARFYSARLGFADYSRILVGRPPIPVRRALNCVWEKEAALG